MLYALGFLFASLFFLSALALVIGLAKPSLVLFKLKNKNRKSVLIVYGSSLATFFILVAAVAPPVEKTQAPEAQMEQANNLAAKPEVAPEVAEGTQSQTQEAENQLEKTDSGVPAEIKNLDVWEKIIIAFDGGYSKKHIKARMDKAMMLYELELTDENYNKAASSLVALKNKFGVKEVDILDYMIKSYSPNLNISFPDMAGIATAVLASQ